MTEAQRAARSEWMRWVLASLGSALLTAVGGVWYMSSTLTGINDHLKRLDEGQAAIMAQHQALSWELETVKANQLVVITMLHDEHPDKVPLPDTSGHDGFEPAK